MRAEAVAHLRVARARLVARSARVAKRSARQPKPSPPRPIATRSNISVVIATPQPPSTGPTSLPGSSCDVVDEDLVEVRVAGDLAQRAHAHAVGVHRQHEHRQPLCLGTSGSVRASSSPKAACWALVVHTFWPDTRQLPSSWRLRARLDAGEVRAGGRLGEELAPDLLAGQHRPEVALLLVLGAVGDQRRAEHADADHVEEPRHAGAADLLVDDDLMQRAEPLAAVLRGPGDGGEPGLGELALPLAVRGDGLHRPRGRGAAAPLPRARRARRGPWSRYSASSGVSLRSMPERYWAWHLWCRCPAASQTCPARSSGCSPGRPGGLPQALLGAGPSASTASRSCCSTRSACASSSATRTIRCCGGSDGSRRSPRSSRPRRPRT